MIPQIVNSDIAAPCAPLALFSAKDKKIVRLFMFSNIIKVYMIITISLEGVDTYKEIKNPFHSITPCLPCF